MPRLAFPVIDASITKYLLFGIFQFSLDLALFIIMQKIGFASIVANVISRLTAAVAGYFLNKQYTFGISETKTYAMVKRYWVFWLFMTGLSSLLIYAWDYYLRSALATSAGKFIIECGLCVLGYLISKKWVYKNDRE